MIHLDDSHSTNDIFCYAALTDKKKGTLYTDAMGALPTRTLDGHQYYFIAYNYDSNYIFATPIKDTTDTSILTAFTDIFEELKDKGHKPTFNITDNQAAKQIKWYLKQEESEYQIVEPKNHQVNAAEWAIQMFKNHFIRGLCVTDVNWPLQLWDQLTTQAVITCNLLQTSHTDPTKSAYHQHHGQQYNWNRYPMAPPGIRAIIHEDPGSCTSWGPRGMDAWYCGPAMDHYCNCHFYVPETCAYQISASFDLFPQHCALPDLNAEQHTKVVGDELISSIQALPTSTKTTFVSTMREAIENLANNKPT